jgi:ParB family chromosome partitioning protein
VFASETEIAEATGQSQPNVNKTLAILRLSAPVLEVLKEDPKAFAMSALYELVLYEQASDTASALQMAQLVKEGEAGRKEIQEARAKVQSPRQRKRKEISRQYKIQRNGQQIGHLKEWDSGKVSFEIILSETTDREALVAELRSRFDLAETETLAAAAIQLNAPARRATAGAAHCSPCGHLCRAGAPALRPAAAHARLACQRRLSDNRPSHSPPTKLSP